MKKAKGFGDSNSPKKSKLQKLSPETMEKWIRKAAEGNVKYQMKWTNYCRNMWNVCSEEPDSTMIHERDYVPMDCCICGKHMPSIHDTHSPDGVAPHCTAKEALEKNLPYRCCSECNSTVVTSARIRRHKGNTFHLPIFDFFNQDLDPFIKRETYNS